MDDDERLGCAGWPDDLDLTRDDDEEGHDLRAGFDEHLALVGRSRAPLRRDSRGLAAPRARGRSVR